MKRKIISILIVILFIVSMVLLAILIYFRKNTNVQVTNNVYYFDSKDEEILKYNFYDITYEKEFFELEDYINTYYENCKSENNEYVCNMLQENYKNINKINNQNVFDKIIYYKRFNNFLANKIYYQYDQTNEDISIYYIDGFVWSNEYKNQKEVFIKLYEDLSEQVIYIYPQAEEMLENNNFEKIIYDEQKQFLKNYKEEQITLDSDEDEIEEDESEEIIQEKEQYYEELKNQENEDEEQEDEEIEDEITDEYIVKKLYNNYKIYTIYSIQDSYKMLSEEFRQNYFKNINKYKKFIEQNREKLEKGIVNKYKVTYRENDVIYSVIDNNNMYYNFYIDGDKKIKIDFKNM